MGAFLGRILDWHGCIGRWALLKVLIGSILMYIILGLPLIIWALLNWDFLGYVGLENTLLYNFASLEEMSFEALIALAIGLIFFHWAAAMISMATFYALICAHAKRLNDIRASKWWLLLLSIPIISQLMTLFLLLMPGYKEKPDQYFAKGVSG